MEYFIFKGIDSRTMGIVENMPSFIRAEMDVNIITIPGNNGVRLIENTFKPYTDYFDFIIRDVSKIDDVIEWLNGKGDLIVSDELNKVRKVAMYSEQKYIRKTKIAKSARINFIVYDPFKYSIAESDITITSPGNIENYGTVYSEPLIKVTGTGEVTLTINGFDYTYNFDTPFVYLDSSNREAYASAIDIEGTRKTRRLTSEFNRKYQTYWPILEVGTNVISWTGNITELVITKRSRYL